MMTLAKLTFVGLLCWAGFAQPPQVEWTTVIGDAAQFELPFAIIEATDQSLVCVGHCSVGDPGWDGFLLKADALGQTQWTRTLSREAGDILYSDFAECPDGGFMISGWTRPSSDVRAADLLLVRTDDAGDTLWTRWIGGAGKQSLGYLTKAEDGGYLLTGFISLVVAETTDVYLVKVDSDGFTQWERSYHVGDPAWGTKAGELADGGYFVAGATEHPANLNRDYVLIRTNESGDTLWTRVYSLGSDDLQAAAHTPADGGFILVGTADLGIWSEYLSVMYIVKTDADGDILWTRSFGHVGCADGAYALQLMPDGGYMIGGATQWLEYEAPLDSLHDVYVIRLDANGDSLWSLEFEDDGHVADCRSISTTSDGGYVLACLYGTAILGGDIELIKLGPELKAGGQILPPLVESVTLLGNYPNPFNASTKISFALPRRQDVALTIYDIVGRSVQTLINEPMAAGEHQFVFDADNLPSGTYVYAISAGGAQRSRKMIIIR